MSIFQPSSSGSHSPTCWHPRCPRCDRDNYCVWQMWLAGHDRSIGCACGHRYLLDSNRHRISLGDDVLFGPRGDEEYFNGRGGSSSNHRVSSGQLGSSGTQRQGSTHNGQDYGRGATGNERRGSTHRGEDYGPGAMVTGSQRRGSMRHGQDYGSRSADPQRRRSTFRVQNYGPGATGTERRDSTLRGQQYGAGTTGSHRPGSTRRGAITEDESRGSNNGILGYGPASTGSQRRSTHHTGTTRRGTTHRPMNPLEEEEEELGWSGRPYYRRPDTGNEGR